MEMIERGLLLTIMRAPSHELLDWAIFPILLTLADCLTNQGWGDADFRTLSVALKEVTPRGIKSDVVPLHLAVSYMHPVPWC